MLWYYRSVQYYDMTGHLNAFSVDQPPDDLEKKTTLLMYFAKYMDEHLIQVKQGDTYHIC